MATDIERLVVSLEASTTKFTNAMAKASGAADKSAQRIERRFTSMNDRLQGSFSSFGRGIATAFAGAAALRGAQSLIDASTRIENSLKVAGLAGEDLTNVYDKLFASAQRNAAPVEALTELYGRASLVQKELGVSTEELLGFTDNVAVALRVSGKSAAESSGALLQLSQALGSGTVRAEEFNSILEGALPIAQAAAAGLEEAGGSVAKLRGLVVDGKISSEAFFAAFQAGSVILTEQVANAELTVSQGFIRLQNVLIDTAGKFDNATGASGRVGGALQQLATQIEQAGSAAEANAPAINRFLDFISDAGNQLGNSMFEGTAREFEQIGAGVDAVAGSFDRYGASVTDAELATAQAEQALSTFALNSKGKFGELDAVVQDLIQQLLEGRGTADSAAEAIAAIGGAGEFGPLIGQLGSLVTALFAVRSEAVATAAAVAATASGQSSGTNISDQRSEQLSNRPKPTVKPVSIANYAAPSGGAAGGGGKGGGASASDRFGDAMKDRQREIDELNREIDLRGKLGASYDANGLAMEKLRVQLDLENEAARAGLALTPERQAAINALAEGYAAASVEVKRMADAQEEAQKSMADWYDTGRSAARGFIDDLVAGKSATEALGNALNQLGSKLIDVGLGALFGSGSGSSPFGMIGKAFGFSGGGYTGPGGKYDPAGIVHKGEYVFDQQATRNIGVSNLEAMSRGMVPSIPSMPSASASSVSMPITIHAPGADAAGLARVEQEVRKLQASMPSVVKKTVRDMRKYGQG
jgi:tape measure domain-containing protein